MNMKPVFITGLFTVFDDILPLSRSAADVIKNSVKHDLHSPLVKPADQRAKEFLIAKMRIDRAIVQCIVFMVGRRGKDRRQINAAYPQVFQIVQFVYDPLQIPSEKSSTSGSLLPHGKAFSGDKSSRPLAKRSGKFDTRRLI